MLHDKEIFSGYDYVLLDCPPRLSTGCINALTAADYVIVPTSLSQSDINAVPRSLRWLELLRPILKASFLGAVPVRCTVRAGKLSNHDIGQLTNLEAFIAPFFGKIPGISAYKGHKHTNVMKAVVPNKPVIYQAATAKRPAVVVSTSGRELFEPLVNELEEKLTS